MAKAEAQLPNGFQDDYYCPYCKSGLYYLWNNGHLIGLGLNRWVYCKDCEKTFTLELHGFRENKLDMEIVVK